MNIFKYGMINHPRFWLRNIGQFFHNIRYAWQRATRGFSDPDWWELDWRSSKLFCAELRYFAKHCHSFPQALAEKYGNDGYDQWKDILNQIADNLEKYADTRFENAELSEHYWKEAFSLLSEWHTNMWD